MIAFIALSINIIACLGDSFEQKNRTEFCYFGRNCLTESAMAFNFRLGEWEYPTSYEDQTLLSEDLINLGNGRQLSDESAQATLANKLFRHFGSDRLKILKKRLDKLNEEGHGLGQGRINLAQFVHIVCSGEDNSLLDRTFPTQKELNSLKLSVVAIPTTELGSKPVFNPTTIAKGACVAADILKDHDSRWTDILTRPTTDSARVLLPFDANGRNPDKQRLDYNHQFAVVFTVPNDRALQDLIANPFPHCKLDDRIYFTIGSGDPRYAVTAVDDPKIRFFTRVLYEADFREDEIRNILLRNLINEQKIEILDINFTTAYFANSSKPGNKQRFQLAGTNSFVDDEAKLVITSLPHTQISLTLVTAEESVWQGVAIILPAAGKQGRNPKPKFLSLAQVDKDQPKECYVVITPVDGQIASRLGFTGQDGFVLTGSNLLAETNIGEVEGFMSVNFTMVSRVAPPRALTIQFNSPQNATKYAGDYAKAWEEQREPEGSGETMEQVQTLPAFLLRMSGTAFFNTVELTSASIEDQQLTLVPEKRVRSKTPPKQLARAGTTAATKHKEIKVQQEKKWRALEDRMIRIEQQQSNVTQETRSMDAKLTATSEKTHILTLGQEKGASEIQSLQTTAADLTQQIGQATSAVTRLESAITEQMKQGFETNEQRFNQLVQLITTTQSRPEQIPAGASGDRAAGRGTNLNLEPSGTQNGRPANLRIDSRTRNSTPPT